MKANIYQIMCVFYTVFVADR